ncbi:MAG: hypothetical protein D6828_05840, partial [Nitrospirae bacterium]
MPEDVIIHHDGALGDVVLSLPVIKLIRERSSSIRFIGRGAALSLLSLTELVDECQSSESPLFTELYVDGDRFSNDIRRYFQEYDRAIIFSKNRESTFLRRISALIPKIDLILTRPEEERIHVSTFQLRQLGGDINGIDL